MAGKRVRCPACQAVLVVPDLASAIQPPERVGAVPMPGTASAGNVGGGLPDPFAAAPELDIPGQAFRRRKPQRQLNAGLVQMLLAGGAGLLVTLAVTGFVILSRNGRIGTAAAANTNSAFREFVSTEGKFRVQMPGTPMQKRQRIGPVSLVMYTLENRDGAYMAGYCDVPIPFNEPEWQTQRRLDGAREGAIRNVNGGLLKENRIRLHGRDPGREIEANVPGKGIIRARFYVVGRRMYQMMVIGTPAFARSADATRFLDSLSRTN
jgi:hypothetical protein